jgi:hypothetical protein
MSAQVPAFQVYYDGDKINEMRGANTGSLAVGVSPLLSCSLTHDSVPQEIIDEANSVAPSKSVIQIKSLEKYNAAVRSARTVPRASS